MQRKNQEQEIPSPFEIVALPLLLLSSLILGGVSFLLPLFILKKANILLQIPLITNITSFFAADPRQLITTIFLTGLTITHIIWYFYGKKAKKLFS